MPEFRVLIHRVQIVNGEEHYHVHLLAPRGDVWAVCGVLMLHPAEWERFQLICEVTSIAISSQTSEATATL